MDLGIWDGMRGCLAGYERRRTSRQGTLLLEVGTSDTQAPQVRHRQAQGTGR